MPKRWRTHMAHAFEAFEIRNFRILWACSLFSVVGVWLHRVAESWLVIEMTDSPFWVGFVGFLSFAPALFLSPYGGLVSDRYPKRALLLITQGLLTLMALAMTILSFSGLLQVWHIAVLALANGFIMSFDMPIRQAFMVEVVGRDKIHSAAGLNSMGFNLGRSVGPAIAGLILAHAEPGYCFAYNTFSFTLVMFGLWSLKAIPAVSYASAKRQGAMLEGWRYLLKQREVVAMILVLTTLSIFIYPYVNQLPVFARHILTLGPEGFGWLMAMVGIGAVLGAVYAAMLVSVSARAKAMRLLPLLYCPALFAFALSETPVLSGACLLLCSFGTTATLSMTNASVQTLVSDEMRGRVMGAYASAFNGIFPYGVLLAGTIVDLFDAPTTFAVYAFITGLSLIALFRFFRSEWQDMEAPPQESRSQTA